MNAIHADFWLPERVSQYVDTIVEGINEHFLGRRKKCRRYTLCSMWIQNGSHFRCPSCGAEYRPWSAKLTGGGWDPETKKDTSGGGAIDAQKIMVCTAHDLIKGNTDVDDIMPGTVRFYLVLWTDSKAEILKMRLKEIMLELAEETRSMSDVELLDHVRPLVDQGRFGYMTKVPFKDWIRQRIDTVNTTAIKNWKYDHIKDSFLMGQADENMPILDQAASIRMWALAKYMLMARVLPRHAAL